MSEMGQPRVFVNGDGRAVDKGTTVGDLITALGAADHGVAAALNGRVVARDAWTTTAIADGDRLEVLTAAPGG
ncbi:MAG TPA: sulfur carrier protein ThiS [Acidimicrobiales bacterium]|nr:sulfur carrier protein ThiS [Acidimicrobiales bacterium]